MSDPEHIDDSAIERGHESLAVSMRAIGIGMIGLLLLVVVTLLAMSWFSARITPRPEVDGADTWLGVTEGPPQRTVGISPRQAQEREAIEQRQHEWLNKYAWLDEAEEVARVPVERAMQMILEQGFSTAFESLSNDSGGAVGQPSPQSEAGGAPTRQLPEADDTPGPPPTIAPNDLDEKEES